MSRKLQEMGNLSDQILGETLLARSFRSEGDGGHRLVVKTLGSQAGDHEISQLGKLLMASLGGQNEPQVQAHEDCIVGGAAFREAVASPDQVVLSLL